MRIRNRIRIRIRIWIKSFLGCTQIRIHTQKIGGHQESSNLQPCEIFDSDSDSDSGCSKNRADWNRASLVLISMLREMKSCKTHCMIMFVKCHNVFMEWCNYCYKVHVLVLKHFAVCYIFQYFIISMFSRENYQFCI